MFKTKSYGIRSFIFALSIGISLVAEFAYAIRTDKPQNPEIYETLSLYPSADEVAAYARKKADYKAYIAQMRKVQRRCPTLSREQAEYQVYVEERLRIQELQKRVAESMEKN